MTRHFAWRPQVDRDPLFNPFIPADRTRGLARLDEQGEELEDVEETRRASGDVPGDSTAGHDGDVLGPETKESP